MQTRRHGFGVEQHSRGAAEAAAPGGQAPSRTALLVTVACGTLLNPLNSSLIAVALASIRDAFALSFADAAWLISAYYLASAVGQPVLGRLADLLGRRRLFIAGLLVVAVASALAPLAPTFEWLVVLRVVQALGSSTLFPAGMGIVRAFVTDRQGQALSVLSVFASVSAGFGPTLGGYLVGWAGWPAIFLVNLPFAALALGLAVRVLPRDRGVAASRSAGGIAALLRRLDLPGAALFALALGCALAFLLSLDAAPLWWALPIAGLAGAAFVRTELRAAAPFIDLRSLRRNRTLVAVYGQFVAVNLIFYSVFFGIPNYLQDSRHFSAEKTGLIMLAVAGLGVVTTPTAGRMIDRTGPRPSLLIGSVFMTAGSALLLTIGETTSTLGLVLVLAVFGVSVGFNNLSLQAALYSAASEEEMGTASGLFMTSRFLGTILSTSLLGVAFGQHIGVAQLHVVAIVLAALGALVLAQSIRSPTLRGT
jgi:MFS family permease